MEVKIQKGNDLITKFILDKEEIVIGRTGDSSLVLEDHKVSRKHARIFKEGDSHFIEDLNSSNGTFYYGKKITKRRILEDDVYTIGPFEISFSREGAGPAEEKKEEIIPQEQQAEATDEVIEFKKHIHSLLIDRLDLKRAQIDSADSQEVREKVRTAVSSIIDELKGKMPKGATKNRLVREIIDEALGLGPLEELLADESVTEIMVNKKDQIYIEKKGKLVLSDKKFINDEQVRGVIERIVTPLGRRIDESSPLVDARLKDGSRVNAVIPPLALKGPCITIRKFSKKPFKVHDLIRFGSLTDKMAEFLELAVSNRQNIFISGGTGSGKTTLLNVMSSFIPHDERIVTVEDAAELQLPQDHVVSLESRPPNIEGKGAILIRDLVKNCLRMRPDRIVVGECRGGEALDMLQAMNTGHDGSLTTAHANSPRDALSRIETMVLMAGMDLPTRAIREQMASAVNLIVQQSRLSDGSRKITHITEITGMEGDKITLQDIFLFKQTGYDKENQKVIGEYVATGMVPKFVDKLRNKGISVDLEMFR
ncbi:MAG: Flp pilus assembly complex ATPase component TadA [Candidatus Aureabacteria bacterium]|nr:Flp pilus assembly complex ATPase component TadA [Candidatus Auribacterota bacterium]